MSIRLSRNSDPRLSSLTLDKPMRHFVPNHLAVVISFIFTTITALSTSELTAQPPLTPQPGTFPIGCFPGPPAKANTLQNWRSIKDANFTLMCPVYRYDDQAQLKMLQHCEQLGLKAVVNVKIPMPNAETPLPDDWRDVVQEYVAKAFGKVDPDFLCYDHYPFMKHGRDHLDSCENLELARTATCPRQIANPTHLSTQRCRETRP